MKNLVLTLIMLLICSVTFAQEQQTVESFSISTITDAIKLLVVSVNWLFVIVFMLITWILNDTSEAINTTWLTWFSKIPKAIRAFIIGVLVISVFAWAYKVTSRNEIFKLLLSLLTAMAIYKFGIHKVFRFISTRIGLKFE